MEKLKEFLKKCGSELFSLIFAIIFLGCGVLPFFHYDISYNGVETSANVSFYNIVTGGNFGNHQFSSDPFFTMCFIFFLVAIILVSLIFILEITKKFENIIPKLNGAILLILVSLVIGLAIGKPTYEFVDSDWNSIGGVEIDIVPLGFTIELICLFFMTICSIRRTFENITFNVKDLVEISMLVGLALVLDQVKLFKMPTGGSVNLAGIPLLIIALRHGPVKGFIASSLIFGLLSCLIDGYGFQFFPFDYFIAFSGYAFAGVAFNLFKKYLIKDNPVKSNIYLVSLICSLLIGGIFVIITRVIGSSLSSMIFYGYDLKGAFIYNIGYVGVSAAISCACDLALSKPIQMINSLYPVNSK